MAGIHPTAIIDPSARLGAGVEIGPYCVIGADVTLGDECVLASHVTIAGPTTIGARNRFYPYTSIGQRSQDLKYAGEPTYLEIGDDNAFREFCTVNRGTAPGSKTVVGSHNNFLAYAHVAHDCTVGNHVIFSKQRHSRGTCHCGGSCRHWRPQRSASVLPYRASCHRRRMHEDRAGRRPVHDRRRQPGGTARINQVGMERRDFAAEEIRTLREAFRLLCRSNLNVKQACESIREQLSTNSHIEHLLSFIEASKRGIVR